MASTQGDVFQSGMRCYFVVVQANARLETRNVGVLAFDSEGVYDLKCATEVWRGLSGLEAEIFGCLEDEIRSLVSQAGLKAALEIILGWSHFLQAEPPRAIESESLKQAANQLFRSLVLGEGEVLLGTPQHQELLNTVSGRSEATPSDSLSFLKITAGNAR